MWWMSWDTLKQVLKAHIHKAHRNVRPHTRTHSKCYKLCLFEKLKGFVLAEINIITWGKTMGQKLLPFAAGSRDSRGACVPSRETLYSAWWALQDCGSSSEKSQGGAEEQNTMVPGGMEQSFSVKARDQTFPAQKSAPPRWEPLLEEPLKDKRSSKNIKLSQMLSSPLEIQLHRCWSFYHPNKIQGRITGPEEIWSTWNFTPWGFLWGELSFVFFPPLYSFITLNF